MSRIVILMVVVKMTGKSHLHHHRRKEYKVCSEAAFGDFESIDVFSGRKLVFVSPYIR